MGRLHRLREVTLESGQERPATVFRPRVRRERDRRDLATALERQHPHAANQRQAVLAGHGDVAQEDVGLQALDELARLASRTGRGDEHPVLLEDQPQCLARVLLVVDEQDRQALLGAAFLLAQWPGGQGAHALARSRCQREQHRERAARP